MEINHYNEEIKQELLLKDNLLSATAEAMNELVKNLDFNQAIKNAFNILGRAISVDRIVLFENNTDEMGKILASYKFEWISDPSYTQKNDPSLLNIPIEKVPSIFETLQSRKPLITNVADIEPVMRGILEAHQVKSIMLFPIYVGELFWGFVGFDDCNKERTWSEAEKAILLSFATTIAGIVERKEVEQELLRRQKMIVNANKREALLRKITGIIRNTLDINQIKQNIVTEIGKTFNADRCFISLFNDDKKEFFAIDNYSEYLSSPGLKSMVGHIPDSNMCKYAISTTTENQAAVAIYDTSAETDNSALSSINKMLLEVHHIKSVYGIPIFYNNRLIGSIVCHYTKEPHKLSDEDIEIIITLASQTGIALYHAELFSEMKQKATNEKTLRQIMLSSVYSFDFENIIHTMVTETGELMKSDRCFYIGFDLRTDCNHQIHEYAEHLSSSNIISHRLYPFKKADTIGFSVLARKNNVITCDDMYAIDLPEASRRMLEFLSVKSYLIAPVFYGETYYGAIVLHYVNYKTFTQTDVEIMEAVANQTALVMRQAELYKALTQTTGKTESILTNIADGVITVNQHGLIETANPAIEKMFGYTKDELFERPIAMLLPPENYTDCAATGFLADDECYVKNNIINNTDYIATRRDGTTFYIETTMSTVALEKGALYIFLIRDITQRKKVEKLKSEFISTVSHELRTPLTSIKGSLELISSGIMGELTERGKNVLEIAGNNCVRLLALINDLLDMEKMESGKMTFSYEVVEIMPVIKQSIEDNKHYAQQNNITFILDNNPCDAQVKVDKNRLMQIMANLLSNAAKFSNSDSKVDISVSRQNDGVRVSVTNYGYTIPKEFHNRIFQKFAQADSSDTRQQGGTGLGLSICKSLIEKMNGSISFSSDQQNSTTFYFDLPELL